MINLVALPCLCVDVAEATIGPLSLISLIISLANLIAIVITSPKNFIQLGFIKIIIKQITILNPKFIAICRITLHLSFMSHCHK